jgi:hypothetical protein
MKRQYKEEAAREQSGQAVSSPSETIRVLFDEVFPAVPTDELCWQAFATDFAIQNKGLVPFIEKSVQDCRPVLS